MRGCMLASPLVGLRFVQKMRIVKRTSILSGAVIVSKIMDDRTRYEAVKSRLRAMVEGTAQQVHGAMEPSPYSVREVTSTLDEWCWPSRMNLKSWATCIGGRSTIGSGLENPNNPVYLPYTSIRFQRGGTFRVPSSPPISLRPVCFSAEIPI